MESDFFDTWTLGSEDSENLVLSPAVTSTSWCVRKPDISTLKTLDPSSDKKESGLDQNVLFLFQVTSLSYPMTEPDIINNHGAFPLGTNKASLSLSVRFSRQPVPTEEIVHSQQNQFLM